jgi:PII-like signaling protein
MSVTQVATRIVIFLSEDDRLHHRGLHEEILSRASEAGMAGATVWRGLEGFGASGHVRTARFPDAATGLPLAVELIDVPERIEAFLDVVRQLAPDSLVTREQVEMTRFGEGSGPRPDDAEPPDGRRRRPARHRP